MSNNNDVSLPISFPVDTARLAGDIKAAQALIDSIQGSGTPLFPDQSAALGKFTLKIQQVKKVHDAVARSIGASTKALAQDSFAMHASLVKTANASVILAQRSAAAIAKVENAARGSASRKPNIARVAPNKQRGPGATHTAAGDQAARIVDESKRVIAAQQKIVAATAAMAAAVGKHNTKAAVSVRKLALARRRAATPVLNELVSAEKRVAKSRLADVRASRAAAAQMKRASGAAIANAKAIDKVTKAKNKTATASKKATVAEEKETNATKKMSKSSKFLVGQMTRLSRIVAIVQGPLGPIAGRLTAAATALRSMGVFALGLGLAAGAMGKALRRAIPAAIDMQRTMGTLAAATKDASASFDVVIASSRRTGNTLGTMAGAYAQLAAAARGTALEGKGIQKVFHAINTAGLALRLDANQTKGAMKALEQMLSKGTVSSEELRQQLGERLPGAYRLAADAMGVTTQVLSKQLALGKILAEDFLPKFADATEKAYKKAADAAENTLGVALKKLGQATDELFATAIQPELLNIFTTSLKSITKSLHSMSDTMRKATKDGFSLISVFKQVGWALAAIVDLLIISKMQRIITVLMTSSSSAVRVATALGLVTKQTTFLGRASLATGIQMKLMWRHSLRGLKRFGKAATLLIRNNPWLLIATAAMAAWQYSMAVANDALDKQMRASTKSVLDETRAQIKALVLELSDLEKTRKDFANNKGTASDLEQHLARRFKLLDDLRAAAVRLSKTEDDASSTRDNATATELSNMDKVIDKAKKVTAATFQRNTAVAKLVRIQKDLAAAEVTVKAGQNADGIESRAMKAKADSSEARKQFKAAKARVLQLKIDQVDVESRRVALQKLVTAEEKKAATTARKQADARNKAVLSEITAHLVAEVKIGDASVRTDDLRKKLNLKRGSRERLLQDQLLARRQLATKQSIDLIKTKAGAETDALNKQQANVRTALDETQRIERDAAAATIDRIHARSNIIDLSAARRIRAAKRIRDDANAALGKASSGDFSGTDTGKAAAALRDARITEDFNATRDANMAKFNSAWTIAQSSATMEMDIERALQQFKDDTRAAELQKDAELANSKIALLQDQHQRMVEMQNVFSQISAEGQQIDLNALSDGFMAFGERVSGMKDLNSQIDEARTKGDTKKELALKKQLSRQQVSLASDTLGAISGLMNSHNRAAFEVGKAAAVGQALVDTFSAVNKALASAPPPFNFALAAIVGAAGAANVAKIVQTKFGSKSAGVRATTPAGGSAPSAAAVSAPAATPAAVPANIVINLHPQFLDPSQITPDAMQLMADSLAAPLNDAFGRGQHLAVRAA